MVVSTARLAALLLCWTLAAAGCTPLSREARTTLDPRTGVSLSVADEPLVLARERRDLAAQARDYLTVIATEINTAGSRRLLLCVHEWSTIDARARGNAAPLPTPLLIVADGRDLWLSPLAQPPLDAVAVARELARPGDAEVYTTFYPIEAEALRYLASAGQLSAVFPARIPPLPFSLWRDGRPAQLRLLEAIGR